MKPNILLPGMYNEEIFYYSELKQILKSDRDPLTAWIRLLYLLDKDENGWLDLFDVQVLDNPDLAELLKGALLRLILTKQIIQSGSKIKFQEASNG